MRKKRRKAVYVPYDYEAAYMNSLDKMEEANEERILKEGKVKSIYATKEIRSGDQLEVEIYPEFTKGQKDQIPDEGKRKRQRQAQKNLNDKNSKKMCERVIGENFTDRDIWATFTYTDDNMPASMEVATKNMQNYIRRLNYQRKKQGLSNARYVYVTECSEKGRWHHHIVMDGDVDMDTVEAVWNLGKRNEIRRLQRDENGLVGMARYITKEKSKKAISLNQIAKEEIKGTGYEIRVNGQKVVSEKGMPDRFYGEIRILKPVIDRDYMLVSDGMTEKAIRSCMKKILKDIKEEQKKWKLMDR